MMSKTSVSSSLLSGGVAEGEAWGRREIISHLANCMTTADAGL